MVTDRKVIFILPYSFIYDTTLALTCKNYKSLAEKQGNNKDKHERLCIWRNSSKIILAEVLKTTQCKCLVIENISELSLFFKVLENFGGNSDVRTDQIWDLASFVPEFTMIPYSIKDHLGFNNQSHKPCPFHQPWVLFRFSQGVLMPSSFFRLGSLGGCLQNSRSDNILCST